MPFLFTYGTLRFPQVQESLFGRLVPADDDALPGFRVDEVLITDPQVVAASGTDRHPILRRSSPDDAVAGGCLSLDDIELAAADRYEVADYRRVEVTLASGRRAWVYASAGEAEELQSAR